MAARCAAPANPLLSGRVAVLSVATWNLSRMTTTVALLLALAVGAALGAAVARALTAGRAAGLAAERELLRERVIDLEAPPMHDRELAATLSPLAATLQRVEHHVAPLERDRVEQFSRLDEQITAVRVSGEALRAQTGGAGRRAAITHRPRRLGRGAAAPRRGARRDARARRLHDRRPSA